MIDLAAETLEAREARHLTEDLNQSIPPMYHELIRILIQRAVFAEKHRCAKAALDFATTLSQAAPSGCATPVTNAGSKAER